MKRRRCCCFNYGTIRKKSFFWSTLVPKNWYNTRQSVVFAVPTNFWSLFATLAIRRWREQMKIICTGMRIVVWRWRRGCFLWLKCLMVIWKNEWSDCTKNWRICRSFKSGFIAWKRRKFCSFISLSTAEREPFTSPNCSSVNSKNILINNWGRDYSTVPRNLFATCYHYSS